MFAYNDAQDNPAVASGDNTAAKPTNSAAQKPPEKGHISGQVVNEVTGEPLRKVTITIHAVQSQNRETVTATTDAAGKYQIADLDPGKYSVRAERNGYVRRTFGAKSAEGSGTILSVGPGGTAEANLKLTPHSVVTGRVVDEDGEPMAGVSVSLRRFSWTNGKRTLTSGEGAQTNDLGEYRIFGVAPGKYYLSASYNRNQYERLRDGGDAAGLDYAPVYYPGTADPHSATQLEVPKADHLNGIDLTMQKVRSYRVRGRVVSSLPGQSTVTRLMVILTPKQDSDTNSWEDNKLTQTDADGKFVFNGVLPGPYELNGSAFGQDAMTSARQEVTVSHEHVNGVTLTMAPGWEMKGTVRVEGDTPGKALTQVFVNLGTDDVGAVRYGPSPYATPKDDGTFTLKNIGSERYRVASWNLPDGFYMKSARVGAADVAERATDFAPFQGGTLEIVFSPKAGIAEGSVKNEKDELVTTGTVVLIPELAKRSNRTLFKEASLDQYGRYKITGITPGSYSLYAFQGVESGIWDDPDYLKTIEKQATDLTIAESGHETNDLKAIVGDEP